MNTKIVLQVMMAILLLGIFLRFYKLSTNFIFGLDQAEDMFSLVSIQENIKSGQFNNLPLIGEPGTYKTNENISLTKYPVYSGVFYLYLLLPIAVLTSFNPVGLTMFISAVSALSILVIYLIGKELFDTKTGLISAFLFSTSYFLNVYSRAIWTPSLVPSFVIFSLYLLILIKKKNKLWLWPFFAFLVSGVSQIHDSGYFYMVLMMVTTLVLRPSLPKSISKKILTGIMFLIPVVPTIIYEYKTKFDLIPKIVSAFRFQLEATGGQSSLLTAILQKFLEFWLSAIDPLHFNYAYIQSYFGLPKLPTVMFFSGIGILSLIFVIYYSLNFSDISRKVIITFLIFFLAVPFFSAIYYADSIIGLKPLDGTIFALVGAIPIVILFLGSFLGYFWGKNSLSTIFVAIFLILFGYLNISLIKNKIWENGERKYDYSDKLKIASLIKNNAHGQKYDLIFNDPNTYGGGVEFFYLFNLIGITPPVSLNGKTSYITLFHEYVFDKGIGDLRYTIAGRNVWNNPDVIKNNLLIGESGEFRLYRNIPK